MSRIDGSPLRPNCAECAAVFAPVKGKSPLTRLWPPAPLTAAARGRLPDPQVGTEGWSSVEQTDRCWVAQPMVGQLPTPDSEEAHCLHLDDARGEFEEPQAQRIELRDSPHRTLWHRHAQAPHEPVCASVQEQPKLIGLLRA